jgi:hypothetical protein
VGDIIEMGKFKFEILRGQLKKCGHHHLIYDIQNKEIICKDCNQILHPFDAFLQLLDARKRTEEDLERRRKELEELESRAGKGLLKATRYVDHAWRSKNMVPCCPHCSAPIFPDDGFGRSMTNKEMALQARRFKNGICPPDRE